MDFIANMTEYFRNKKIYKHKMDQLCEKFDQGALAIICALENHGFEAYAVGGCVRDLLMHQIPHDWDITTSARPEEIISVMEECGWRGIDGSGRRFGTVIAVVSGESYEVTTFRSEIYGQDSHRPESVVFAKTLEEDLSRRDFTVNAMALGRDGTLYDYFDGVKDLKNKRLRTVGSAEDRFNEDALRLFRACRFLGQLDFMADGTLVEAIPSAFGRVRGLSLERFKSEIEKLLVSVHAARGLDLMVRTGLNECSCRVRERGKTEEIQILPELSHLVGLPQQREFHKFDGWYHTLAVVEAAPRTLILRWAALLHDVGKGIEGVRAIRAGKYTDYGHDKRGTEMAKDILTRWRMPSSFINRVSWLVENHMHYHYFANVPEANAVRWLRQIARTRQFSSSAEMAEGMKEITDLCNADIIGCGRDQSSLEGHTEFGRYMVDLCKTIPVSTRDLAYDQRVIAALKPNVAEGFANLLLRVQNGALENNPEALLDAAVRYRRRHNEDC